MASVYHINKGINKPIEFKGLKAQYIAYLAGGLVLLLILFAAMYIIGINLFICLFVIVAAGTALFVTVYHLSNKYGQFGLLKKAARGYIPYSIKFRSRKIFIQLKKSSLPEKM